MKTKITGKVSKGRRNAAIKGIDYAINRLGFGGKNPKLHIAEGWVTRDAKNNFGEPYSELFTGAYNHEEKTILISNARIEQISGLPEERLSGDQLTTFISAHEATHYVQGMTNTNPLDEISASGIDNYDEIHKHFLEVQADLVGGSAIRNIYDLESQYVHKNDFINLSEQEIEILEDMIDISVGEPSKLKDHYHFADDGQFYFYRASCQ